MSITTSEPRPGAGTGEHENSRGSSRNNNEEIENSIRRRKICDVNILRIYLSHSLTSWGDRMWGFAVALYLVILFPESLQYTAIYGFTTCICVIIGGPFIGKWVDKSLRLKAATYAIAIQNLAVSLSAVLLILMIHYRAEVVSLWDGSFQIVFLCAIIVFAVIGELASVGCKIAIEKDWIVVLAENDETKLSKMNATMRTIDLTTSILAPAVVAQIISFISKIAGASFIAAWNLISGGIEIYLLHKIFTSFPELAQSKKIEENIKKLQQGKSMPMTNSKAKIPGIFVDFSSPDSKPGPGTGPDRNQMNNNRLIPSVELTSGKDFIPITPESGPGNYTSFMAEGHHQGEGQGQSLFAPGYGHSHGNVSGRKELIATPRGLIGLPAEDFAEIALTPLQSLSQEQGTPNSQKQQNMLYSASRNPNVDDGFDNFVKTSGADAKSPADRHHHGLGLGFSLLAKSSERLFGKEKKPNCCSQCCQKIVESLIGWKDFFQSPLLFAGLGLALLYMTVLGFDSITIGYMYSQGLSESLIGILTAIGAVSGILGSVSFPFLRRKLGKCAVGNFGFGFETICLILCGVSVFVPGSPFLPEALLANSNPGLNSTVSSDISGTTQHLPYTSVIMFSVGILISRYGLWIADLSVTQFFQEEVPEAQRGILNGVQDSLNQAMNLIKFILVIIFPTPPTFGYLIVLSWLFVLSGWISFMIFTCSWRRRRNKIKCTKMCTGTNLVQRGS